MKIFKIAFIIPLLLLFVVVSAQVKTNFNNETLITQKGQFVKEYKNQIDLEVLQKISMNCLKLKEGNSYKRMV